MRLGVPVHQALLLPARIRHLQQGASGEGQRQLDAAVAACPIGPGHRQGFAALQGVAGMQLCAAPPAHQEAARAAIALLADPFGIGLGNQFGGQGCGVRAGAVWGLVV